VLPCGTLGAQYFQRYGARPDRTFLFPVEPDYELITGLSAGFIEEVARRFKIDPARRRIVACSRLQPHKRIDLAVDAFVRVAADHPDLDLVVMGSGPELENLRARVPAALASRVLWTGFIGDQRIVNAVYRLSHILIHPSSWEPWGLIINEAAAAGMAIIASDVCGAAFDLVREGENGYTFPEGNLEQLTDRLRQALSGANLASMRQRSADVLADWRATADPIQGLVRALQRAHSLTTASPRPHGP
jgi:glycosyltransferase involved in cell wall biosynthesis